MFYVRILINMKNFLKRQTKPKIINMTISVILFFCAVIYIVLSFSGMVEIGIQRQIDLVVMLLCGVVLTYFLNEVGTFDSINQNEQDILEKIEDVNVAINTISKSRIISRKEIEKDMKIEDVWKGATEVDIFAIANTGLLKGNGIQSLKIGVDQGIHFKMASLKPDSVLEGLYKESSIVSDTSLPLSGNVEAYRKQCKRQANDKSKKKLFRDYVEMKTTELILPYSLMIVRNGEEILKVKVDIYGVKADYMDRRSFYIFSDDKANIDYYDSQWKAVWNDEKTTSVEIER